MPTSSDSFSAGQSSAVAFILSCNKCDEKKKKRSCREEAENCLTPPPQKKINQMLKETGGGAPDLNLASGQRAIRVMSMTSKRAEWLKESRWCLMVRWWKSQTKGTIFGCTSCWMFTRKMVAGSEEHPLCRGSDRLHYSPHNHITQRIREHLPMKDFFPVFMSSSLWWKGVCLLHGVQVTESTKKDVVLLFKNEAPLPFSVFSLSLCLSVVFFFFKSMALAAAVVGKVVDSQANNFNPAALPPAVSSS